MSGDVHVRFCESLGGRFPGATRRILITEKQIDRVTGTIPDTESELARRARTRYNDAGLPVEEQEWLDEDRVAITRRSYDAVGHLTSETRPQQVADGSNRKTTYAYGPHRLFVRETTNELGHTTSERYDVATGQRLERRGPNCLPVSGKQACAREAWTRDALGRALERRISVDDPDKGYVPALVEKTKHIDEASPMQVFTARRKNFGEDEWIQANRFYDGLNRLIRKEQLCGDDRVDANTHYSYDALGNRNRIEIPDPRTDDGSTVAYTYDYDGVSRLRRFRRPDGNGLDVNYDGLSRTYTEVTQDGSGSSWTEVYDVFDRLVEVREHYPNVEDGVTRYAYDVNDNLTEITDADGNVTKLEHDFVGNRVAVRRGRRVWRYEYDRNGNRTAKIEPVPEGAEEDAYTTRYAYDDLDRLRCYIPASRGLSPERRRELGISPITYTYDAGRNGVGRLVAARLRHLLVSYGYNARGLTNGQTRSVGFDPPAETGFNWVTQTVRRQYNALDKLTWSEWDDGQQWRISYNDRGQVNTVEWFDPKEGRTKTVADYQRSVAGPPRVRESAFGQRRTFQYDRQGRVVEDQIFGPDFKAPISTRSYTYTDSGDLQSVEGSTAGVSADAQYSYDAQHRIITASGPNGYAGSFSYSAAGNVTKASVRWDGGPSREIGYEYGAAIPQAVNRLISSDGSDYARFAYDRAGNMTERVTPEGGLEFTWDGDGQLREADGRRREIYRYDHHGQRILAANNEGARFWFAERETHFNAEGNQTRSYIHLSGSGATLARAQNGNKIELQYADALNNLMLSLGEGGNVAARFLYGSFGEVVRATGAANHRRRFNGKESDVKTGLRYYGFRYYDPLSLRWNSADPLYRLAPEVGLTTPQRLNLYAFSNNNPLRYYDPDGRAPQGTSGVDEEILVEQCNDDFSGCIPHVEMAPDVIETSDSDSAANMAAGGVLLTFGRWIQRNLAASTLAITMETRGGSITKNPRTGEVEHVRKTEVVKRETGTKPKGKPRGAGKPRVRGRGLLKASSRLGRTLSIFGWLPGVISDIKTYQRAQDAGRSFGEQFDIETRGMKMVIPGVWTDAEPGECAQVGVICNPPGGLY